MDRVLIFNKSNNNFIFNAVKFLFKDYISVTENIEEFKTFEGRKFLLLDFDWDLDYFMYSEDFLDLAQQAINSNGKIVLDYSLEADTAFRPQLIYFLERYKERNLSFDHLFFAYNNSYDMFKKQVRIRNFKLNTLYFPLLLVNTYIELSQYYRPIFQKYDYTAAEKDFLLLNRRISKNKFAALHELVNRGWKNRSLLSAVSVRNNLKFILRDNSIPEWNQTLDKLGLELVDEDDHLYTPFKKPLQLEDDFTYGLEVTNGEFLYKVNPKWYEKAKINIVQETWYKDCIEGFESFDKMIHVTEKTWKAIALNSPFVIIGNRNIIKSVEAFGIRTDFNRSSHDYDEMNDDKRYKGALDYANELAKNYSDEWMREVALHNMRIFWNIDNHRNYVIKHFFFFFFYDNSTESQ